MNTGFTDQRSPPPPPPRRRRSFLESSLLLPTTITMVLVGVGALTYLGIAVLNDPAWAAAPPWAIALKKFIGVCTLLILCCLPRRSH